MTYYQNRDNGLIYTEEEAKRFTAEQVDMDDLCEAMAGYFRLSDLYKYLPEDKQAEVFEAAVYEKIHWLFTTRIETDDLMFAHDCPGHEV